MRPDTYQEDQEGREAHEAREAHGTPTDETQPPVEATSDEDVADEDTSDEDTPDERSLPVEEAPPTRAEPEPEPEPTGYQPAEPEPEPEPTEYQPAEPQPGPTAYQPAEPETEPTAYPPPVAEAAPSAGTSTAVGVAPVEGGARWPEDEAPEFEQRWQEVLLQFVDNPPAATQAAQGLVSEVADQFAAALTVHKRKLDAWSEAGDEDTERLRTAVRGYRSLLDRLLRT